MQTFKNLRQQLDLAEEEALLEKLKAEDPTGKWVSDFVHSDDPKFAGKSKKERIKMALGASYAAKRAAGEPVGEEASPMIKAPKNEFGTKADAFAHAEKHGGKVMKKTFTHPTTGEQHVSYVVKEEVEELDEKDELLARTGMSRINKTPRPGQTDLRNIPAGNRPDSRNKFTDADKEWQRKRLKAAIKGSLGKHTTPNLPEHAEIQESYNDDDLYSVHKDTGEIKHLGNPYRNPAAKMHKQKHEAEGHEVVTGRELNYKSYSKMGEEKEVWDEPNPNKGDGKSLTPEQKAKAKARASRAGRKYPNLIDNMWASKQ